MSKGKKDAPSLIADNRKARHDYHIHETYEAGISLTGTEVKSIRNGRLNLKDSYCQIVNGELFLFQAHISPYEQGNQFNHEPMRTRKLLMHRSEIHKLLGQVKEKGFSSSALHLHSPENPLFSILTAHHILYCSPNLFLVKNRCFLICYFIDHNSNVLIRS